MGFQKWVYIGNGVGILTPHGDIKIFVREVGGTHDNRTGKVEIHGSPLVPDGSLVDLTCETPVNLTRDISVKISNFGSNNNSLPIYIDKPSAYITYKIDNPNTPSQTQPRI